MHERAIERLREVACLAHTVPGTTMRLRAAAGSSLLVSRHCLGADLDPCQFRTAMLGRAGEQLAQTITDVDLVAGLVHIGGGLYGRRDERTHRDERWFVSTLPHDRIVDVLGECPVPTPDVELLDAVIKPDTELGMCAVRISSREPVTVLDEVAAWTLTRCLVDELLVEVSPEPMR